MYWPHRYARGGEILIPGSPDDHVQFADVRDLPAFMIHAIEEGKTAIFNIAGDDTITMKTFQLDANVPWIPPKLTLQGVKYRQNYINSDKAVAAGLRYRPMTETIRDAAAWWQSLPLERRANNKFSYKPEAEAAALAAWHAKMG